MGPIIGIDLGTTTSEICVFKDGNPLVIKNRMFNSEITPSIVGIDEKTRTLLIGKSAEGSPKIDKVIEIKRKMGKNIKVKLGDSEYSPEEISSMILKHIKTYAEEYLRENINEAVITVPANFGVEARKATEIAAKNAGIEVLRIINEPTAAALAYGMQEKTFEGKLLVYDLGGGTFDVSIVDVLDGVVDVLYHDGEQYLGGSDFDKRIIEYALNFLQENHNVFINNDPKALLSLKFAAKKVKEELSFAETSLLEVPFIAVKNNTPINLELEITKTKFEELINDLSERTIAITERAIKNAILNINDIKKVILIGGSTRIPLIRKKVGELFNSDVHFEIEPDLAVSIGAAIQASIIKGSTNAIIMDRVAYGFGIKSVNTIGELFIGDYYSEIIPPNTPMNKSFTQTFTTLNDEQERIEVICFQREPSKITKSVRNLIRLGESTFIDKLPKEPGQLQEIDVTMLYNLNGIIEIEALVKTTGELRRWEIKTAAGTLNDTEGQNRKERLEKLWQHSKYANKAKSLINAVENRLAAMESDDREKVILLLDELKSSLVKDELERIEELIDLITDILINY